MKQGVLTPGRVRVLMSPGDSCFRGYGRRNGERRRKSVRGCIVSPDLSVLNLVIVKKGEWLGWVGAAEVRCSSKQCTAAVAAASGTSIKSSMRGGAKLEQQRSMPGSGMGQRRQQYCGAASCRLAVSLQIHSGTGTSGGSRNKWTQASWVEQQLIVQRQQRQQHM